MAAQETYRVEPMTRYALTANRYKGKPSDIAIFRHREDAEKALHLAYKAAELGEQFALVSVKRYALQLVATTPGDDPNTTQEDYRTLAEFPRLDDAEKAAVALRKAHQAELNKTAKVEPLAIKFSTMTGVYPQN
jgi:hypothetical protein